MEECVSFLVLDGSRLLLERRRLDKDSDAGKLAIPGGRMEPGESQSDTLHRELREELNLRADATRYLCSLQHISERPFLIHYHLVARWQGELVVREAESVCWAAIDGTEATPDLAADRVALAELRRLAESL